jgi:MYXO-CTERM domain-containing protein
MRVFIFLGVLCAPVLASAATIVVTPQDGYQKIEAAKPGDEVVMAPGTYTFRVFLQQKGTPQAPVIIRAQDPNNRPVVDLTGTLVENAPGSYSAGDRGRGCWQLSGATNIQISGIVFQGCRTASNNSAGIRYYNGSIVLIKDCIFRNNDNGLTGGTQDSTATVEFSEFDSNGNLQASAPTHNIYVYGGTFTLRYSYLHDPVQGQNFHVRAHDAVIEYNWFTRPKSYSGDLMTNDDCQQGPCTQNMLLRGNVIIQGMPQNTSQIIAVFNDNGISGVTMNLRAIWNTVVVSAQNAHFVHLSNADGTQMSAEVSNNVISGGANPILVENATKATVMGSNNWFPTGTPVTPLTGSVFGMNPFKNPANKDYTLAMGSNAIGAANTGVMGAPNQEYFQDEANTRMYRLRSSVKDIGAFESTTMGMGVGPYGMAPPNPDGGVNPGGDGGPIGSEPNESIDGGGGTPKSDGGPNGTNGTTGGCGCEASPETMLGGWPAALVLFALRRRKR